MAELFLAGPLPVIVHAGAQSTRDTVALAAHAAGAGAAGVAVIGPPYFLLDDRALLEHFAPARPRARRCRSTSTSSSARAATPCRCRSRRALRERAPNLAGLKVSDAPFDRCGRTCWRASTSSSAPSC